MKVLVALFLLSQSNAKFKKRLRLIRVPHSSLGQRNFNSTLATLYLMQLSPRNRKAMHMQSRVLKNERRLFAWRGGGARWARRGCEELLWLGMNNVCRVNSQPRACLAGLA